MDREEFERVGAQLLLHFFALRAQQIKQGENVPHLLRRQLAHCQPNGLLVAGPDGFKIGRHCRFLFLSTASQATAPKSATTDQTATWAGWAAAALVAADTGTTAVFGSRPFQRPLAYIAIFQSVPADALSPALTESLATACGLSSFLLFYLARKYSSAVWRSGCSIPGGAM